MPSLQPAAIPAAGVLVRQIPLIKKTLAVLKITNPAANIMRYVDRQGHNGDPIPMNWGSVALHYVDGDRPPNTFWITGTAADIPEVYYEVRDEETK